MARILVVDDDHDILKLVEHRLRKGGHQTIAVSSAQEALDVVRDRGKPDIAVLDVGMPGMDGMELLRRPRDLEGVDDLPAIFLSARVQPEDIEAGRALGAAYLTKPFSGVALLNTVTKIAREPVGW